jgi:hypothetical protein
MRYFEHWKKKTISVPGHPAKLSFKIEVEIKTFNENLKLKQYMTTKPPLQKILKGILHTEDENKHSSERMVIIKPQGKNRQVIRQ